MPSNKFLVNARRNNKNIYKGTMRLAEFLCSVSWRDGWQFALLYITSGMGGIRNCDMEDEPYRKGDDMKVELVNDIEDFLQQNKLNR